MKDRNTITIILFFVGIFSVLLSGYSLIEYQYDGPKLALISFMVVCLVLFPIKMPNGYAYTATSMGHLFIMYEYGLGLGTILTTISAATYFITFSNSFRKIQWFRLVTTSGMYFMSLLAAWGILTIIDRLPLFLKVFCVCLVYDGVNLLIRAAIMWTVNGVPFPFFSRSGLQDIGRIQMNVLLYSIILYKLMLDQTLDNLAVDTIFIIVAVALINFFVSAYNKQIVKIEESAQRHNSLFQHNPDIVFTLDDEGKFTRVNPMMEKILGYTPDEIIGRRPEQFFESVSRKKLTHFFDLIMKGETQEFTMDLFHKDGTRREFFITCGPTVVNHIVVGAYGIAKDITAAKESERLIQQMAYYDEVTGLPNRASFNKILGKTIGRAKKKGARAGILFLDLDQFKSVNDALGHQSGDRLLVEVAKRFRDCVEEQYTVSRLGGDEFTIILPEIAAVEECEETAKAILQALEKPVVLQGQDVFITASIGISLFPAHGKDLETLVKNADSSMYKSKETGGNTYTLYSSDLQQASEERLVLQTNLRKALDRGEFYLVYQPQFDLPSREVKGVEALIRWDHPELGFIPPGKFIHEAEKSRVILPIGEWVLRTACAQNKAWQEEGHLPIVVAVNLSSIQFENDGLIDTIRGVLEETGLEPRWLELEITESLLLQNTARTLRILKELKSLGVKISMDDFGTGYSSLSYLKHFPFDVLKIDQSFIQHLHDQPKDELITRAVINLAHSLDMIVIAEGVETEEQFAYLRKHECNGVQGYLISKPLKAEQLKDALWTSQSVYATVREKLL